MISQIYYLLNDHLLGACDLDIRRIVVFLHHQNVCVRYAWYRQLYNIAGLYCFFLFCLYTSIQSQRTCGVCHTIIDLLWLLGLQIAYDESRFIGATTSRREPTQNDVFAMMIYLVCASGHTNAPRWQNRLSVFIALNINDGSVLSAHTVLLSSNPKIHHASEI